MSLVPRVLGLGHAGLVPYRCEVDCIRINIAHKGLRVPVIKKATCRASRATLDIPTHQPPPKTETKRRAIGGTLIGGGFVVHRQEKLLPTLLSSKALPISPTEPRRARLGRQLHHRSFAEGVEASPQVLLHQHVNVTLQVPIVGHQTSTSRIKQQQHTQSRRPRHKRSSLLEIFNHSLASRKFLGRQNAQRTAFTYDHDHMEKKSQKNM